MAFNHSDYYELDYIQSDGTNYIQSNLYVSSGIYEMDVLFPTVNTSTSRHRFMGGYFSSSIRCPLSAQSSKLGYGYRGANKDGLVSYSANTLYHITTYLRSEGSATPCKLNVDGTDYGVTAYTGSSTSSDTYYTDICGYNNAGSHTACPSPLRLYYLKFYNVSGTQEKEFIPAMRKADSVVGLFETYTETFLGPSGTNPFTYGQIIPTGSNNVYIKESGSWIQADAVYIKDSRTWIQADNVYIKDSGSWIS